MPTEAEIAAVAEFLKTNASDPTGRHFTEDSARLMARLVLEAAERVRGLTNQPTGRDA